MEFKHKGNGLVVRTQGAVVGSIPASSTCLIQCCSSYTAITFFPLMIRCTTAIHSFIMYSRNSMFLHAMSTVTHVHKKHGCYNFDFETQIGICSSEICSYTDNTIAMSAKTLQISNDDKVSI